MSVLTVGDFYHQLDSLNHCVLTIRMTLTFGMTIFRWSHWLKLCQKDGNPSAEIWNQICVNEISDALASAHLCYKRTSWWVQLWNTCFDSLYYYNRYRGLEKRCQTWRWGDSLYISKAAKKELPNSITLTLSACVVLTRNISTETSNQYFSFSSLKDLNNYSPLQQQRSTLC